MADVKQLSQRMAHDPCRAGDRWPLGAVPVGTSVYVELRVDFETSGTIESVFAVVDEANDEHAVPCYWYNGRYAASLEFAGNEPHVVFYRFDITLYTGERVSYVPREDRRATSGEVVPFSSDEHAGGFQVSLYDPDFKTPDWLAGTVMYQVFPDRFARGSHGVRKAGVKERKDRGRPTHLRRNWNEPLVWRERQGYDPVAFYGGTIEGVCEKLDYLASLGVEVLYLNPLFESRSYHRYDTADYERIDPLFGTNDEFEVFVAEARSRGISIVLDAVLSHTGDDSRYFNAAGSYDEIGAAQGSASPYYDWYDFSAQDNGCPYRCWWGDSSLPEVEERNESWQRYIIGSGDSPDETLQANGILNKWLRAGARGYRFDVADEVPDEVLHLIRESMKRANPDAALIGEVWEDATTKVSYGVRRTYALGTSLDSVMNYPLRDALIGFSIGAIDAYQLATFLKLQASNYPPMLYRCLMNLLSSHDVERVRTVLSLGKEIRHESRVEQQKAVQSLNVEDDRKGARLQRMVAGIQFALPGSPCLYYGDEKGLQGGSDPFCRATFPWGDDVEGRNDIGEDLADFYRELGMKRKGSRVLREGKMHCAALCDDIVCIVRTIDDPAAISLIVANRSESYKHIAIDLVGSDFELPESACDYVRKSTRFEINDDGIVALDISPISTSIFDL